MVRNSRSGATLRMTPVEDARRAVANRSLAEDAVRRSCLLAPADRDLIRAVFGDGRSLSEMARLMGVSPRTVGRRVQRLVTRLSSDRFRFVGGRLDLWPTTRRRVAIAVILHGRSLRRAAQQLRVSTYVVRSHLQAIEGMFEAACLAA